MEITQTRGVKPLAQGHKATKIKEPGVEPRQSGYRVDMLEHPIIPFSFPLHENYGQSIDLPSPFHCLTLTPWSDPASPWVLNYLGEINTYFFRNWQIL